MHPYRDDLFAAIAPTARVVVVVIGQAGCGACEEFIPKMQAIAIPFARVVPVVFMNAADPRPEVQHWMDQFQVNATPTTLVLKRKEFGGGVWKLEGSQEDAACRQIMDFAYAQSVR